MANDTGAQPQAENKTQPESMPSSNQKIEETESVNVPTENVEDVDVDDTDESLQLPGEVSDRTREQFDKLKKQNQLLKGELERQHASESVFDSMRPKGQRDQAQMPTIEQYADPQTGYIDTARFNRDMAGLVSSARSAQQTVQQYIETQQELEAYTSHPDLNPKAEQFDLELHKSTRAILLDSMFNPGDYGGRTLTLREAADRATGESGKTVEKAQKKAAQEAIEGLSAKEQASLEATGRSDRRNKANESLEELQYRTRRGDRDAIRQRLAGLGDLKRSG